MRYDKRIVGFVLGVLLLTSTPFALAGTVCTCSGGYQSSYWCSGVSSTSCAEAQSNFLAYCDGAAYSACGGGDAICSLTMDPPTSCVQYPSQPGVYYARGNVAYSCAVCIDYQD